MTLKSAVMQVIQSINQSIAFLLVVGDSSVGDNFDGGDRVRDGVGDDVSDDVGDDVRGIRDGVGCVGMVLLGTIMTVLIESGMALVMTLVTASVAVLVVLVLLVALVGHLHLVVVLLLLLLLLQSLLR